MRVWAVSDIHTDYADNMEWLRQLSQQGGKHLSADLTSTDRSVSANGGGSGPYSSDVLLLAGDVSDSLATLEKTLELCMATFAHVFFVPGNHDLWVRKQERSQYNSLEKLNVVQALCARLGVHTAPACVSGVWVFPLYSWYSAEWDREPDVPGSTPISKVMLDFHACAWPAPLSAHDASLAEHFDALNEPAFAAALQEVEAQAAAAGGVRPPVISFSHFLPRQELLPEKRMLYYPNLAKACGSDQLEERIRRLRPAAHVFGHTHFSWDAEVEGVRYVQWPLGYPHEHRRRCNAGAGWLPLPLYDSATGLAAPRDCYWSSYYSMTRRNPSITTPAPWVAG